MEIMVTEFEFKIPDIDINKLSTKIRSQGGDKVQPRHLMKRYTFDMLDSPRGTFVRLRDNGEKITLTYKQLKSLDIGGVREIETEVVDFEKTAKLLSAIGLIQASYEENYREAYNYNGVEVTIDEWPGIPAFAEIEGDSEEQVLQAAIDLNLKTEDAIYGTADEIYKHYGIKIEGLQEITFDNPPTAG